MICTMLIRTYYPQIHVPGMPRILAFGWLLGAPCTVLGSLLAVPKWQALFGLLATVFVLWMVITA